MKSKIIMAALAVALFHSSCVKDVVNGSGPVVTEQRSVSNFTAIDLLIRANVYYTESDEFTMRISAQQNVLNEIITEIENNKLQIRLPWNTNLISYESITIDISAPAVSDFSVSGSGNIFSTDTLHILNADFNISGSGKIDIAAITTNDIDARISGSGDLYIRGGSAANSETSISGSGNADLSRVISELVQTQTSGSGDTRVHAVKSLNAKISGSGKVYYFGNPVISADISGSGKLIPM